MSRAAAARLARGAAGAALRALPPFRGKARGGLLVQFALRALSPAAEEPVWTRMRDGTRLVVDLRSRTERRVFWTGAYDDRLLRAVAAAVPPGSVVVDVGANVGFWAVPLARAGARVHAFEPMPANAERLVLNAAANGLADRLTVVPCALGAERGTLHLALEAATRGAPTRPETDNAVPVEPGAAGATAVELRTLDDVAVELGIEACRFVKIDVEGGELAVLRGGAGFIERHRPLVLAELNAYWAQRAGWDARDLLAFARERGYAVARWDGRGFLPFAGGPSVGIETVLLAPSPSPLFRFQG